MKKNTLKAMALTLAAVAMLSVFPCTALANDGTIFESSQSISLQQESQNLYISNVNGVEVKSDIDDNSDTITTLPYFTEVGDCAVVLDNGQPNGWTRCLVKLDNEVGSITTGFIHTSDLKTAAEMTALTGTAVTETQQTAQSTQSAEAQQTVQNDQSQQTATTTQTSQTTQSTGSGGVFGLFFAGLEAIFGGLANFFHVLAG